MQEIHKDIIVKASQGDMYSFELIFKAYSGYVFNVAFRMTQKKHDAEEITQEVFLTLYHKLKDFLHQAHLKTWIYRVTINMSINYMKKEGKFKNRIIEYSEASHASSVAHEIHSALEKEYKDNVIEKLLEALTPEQRACIILRNMEGLSYQQIAASLKIDINAVRSRLKRAREKLLSIKKEVMDNGM